MSSSGLYANDDNDEDDDENMLCRRHHLLRNGGRKVGFCFQFLLAARFHSRFF